MALRSSDFGIDTTSLEKMAKRMGILPDYVRRGIIATVNQTADDTLAKGVEYITQRVNLEQPYVRKHLRITKRANLGSDTAIITATKRPVLLSRFDARQVFGPSRDRRGRTSKPVPAGVSVSVKPGRRITMAHAFLLRLNGSAVQGLAVRATPEVRRALNKREWKEADQRGDAVLHGPSVSQLFTSAITEGQLLPDVDKMATNLLERINAF